MPMRYIGTRRLPGLLKEDKTIDRQKSPKSLDGPNGGSNGVRVDNLCRDPSCYQRVLCDKKGLTPLSNLVIGHKQFLNDERNNSLAVSFYDQRLLLRDSSLCSVLSILLLCPILFCPCDCDLSCPSLLFCPILFCHSVVLPDSVLSVVFCLCEWFCSVRVIVSDSV